MRSFVNSQIRQLAPSTTTALKNLAAKLAAEGKDIISLVIGEPDFDTPSRIKEAAFRSLDEGFTHYVPTSGIPALKEKIAQKLLDDNQIRVDPDSEIIVTPGAKFAIYAALATFIEQGDEVLVLDPSWISYKPLIQLTGGTAVTVELAQADRYQITREQLERHVTEKSKMIIVNSPNNPTGRVLTDEELEVLVEFIADHQLLTISDEIYEDIVFDSRKNKSLASFDKIKDYVITVNGFSKGYAMTGWRLGYLAAARELTVDMMKIQAHLASCATSFAQAAAVEAFACKNEVAAMVGEYARRRAYLIPALNSLPGFHCPYPDGTFYAFANVDYNGMNSEQFCRYVFEHAGVLVTPGKAFGHNADRCIRISFATKMEELEKAIERIRCIL